METVTGRNVRLGLVGCGGMMGNHAKTMQKVENMEISAVCDIDLKRAEKVAAVLDIAPYVTTDYRTMLDYVDAVLIALPHDLHYESSMFFARHKKHVLVEKPLCNTEEECIRLIDACDEEGVVLMCGYPWRYDPGFLKLKEIIDGGEYGKTIMVSVWTEQYTRFDELHWSQTGRLGGGQFFSHGCHYVDGLLYLLGNPVRGTHMGTKVGTPWTHGEGTSAATIQFESGAIGYHGATWGAKGTKIGYEWQVMTEKGLFAYSKSNGEIQLYDGASHHVPGEVEACKYRTIWKSEDASGKNTYHEIGHFIECVRTGNTPVTDGRSCLQGLRVIWRMYDAEKHGVVADLRGLGLDQCK